MNILKQKEFKRKEAAIPVDKDKKEATESEKTLGKSGGKTPEHLHQMKDFGL